MAMRLHIAKCLNSFPDDWKNHIPSGLLQKAMDRKDITDISIFEAPLMLLEEIDIPDLLDIIFFKKSYEHFFDENVIKRTDFEKLIRDLNELRIKIAHVKRTFSAVDLNYLLEIADRLTGVLDDSANELKLFLDSLSNDSELIVLQVPQGFWIFDSAFPCPCINNLPESDYDPDGGFIGRKADIAQLTKLIRGNVHRVITISGAGGVGKSALAHHLCSRLLQVPNIPFDALIWVSAKEEKLTLTGIEAIEPSFTTYEDLLDTILDVYAWYEYLDRPIFEKEENVDIILKACDKGSLFIVDNLETIKNERIIDFIKDLPPPNKVLITSRLGLGEVERRYQLKELESGDAVQLMRTIAREKGANKLVAMPDKLLLKYAERMSKYPLAIKWAVGQAALGRDINIAVGDVKSPTGDVAKFCFDNIFSSLLNEEQQLVLFTLASYEKPIQFGVLSHITNLSPDELNSALSVLTIASLVVMDHIQSSDNEIQTTYELLSLTRNYLRAKMDDHPSLARRVQSKISSAKDLMEESDRARRQYRYSLSDMGAESEEEKIAATLALTAYQKGEGGDYGSAVLMFKRAVEIAPHFPAIYRNWAVVESDAGNHEKANELMNKAVSLHPEDPRLWFSWGNIERHFQCFDSAFQYYSKALELAPNDAPILGALGEVEKRRGNYDSADTLLHKALMEGLMDGPHRKHEIICYTSLAQISFRWAESLTNQNLVKDALKKLKEGLEYSEKALSINDKDTRAQEVNLKLLLSMAVYLNRFEGFEAAKPVFEKVIAVNPRSNKEMYFTEVACYHLSYGFLELGKIEDARTYFNKGSDSLRAGSNFYIRYNELAKVLGREKSSGRLNNIMPGKGYGFIIDDSTGNSIFVHMNDFISTLSLNDFENLSGKNLQYFIDQNIKGKGPRATRVSGPI